MLSCTHKGNINSKDPQMSFFTNDIGQTILTQEDFVMSLLVIQALWRSTRNSYQTYKCNCSWISAIPILGLDPIKKTLHI